MSITHHRQARAAAAPVGNDVTTGKYALLHRHHMHRDVTGTIICADMRVMMSVGLAVNTAYDSQPPLGSAAEAMRAAPARKSVQAIFMILRLADEASTRGVWEQQLL